MFLCFARNGEVLNSLPFQMSGERVGAVIEDDPAVTNAMNILRRSGVVEHHHDVDDVFARVVALSGGSNLIPGWKPLDVGWEHVFRGAGYPHLENGLEKNVVRRSAPGAIFRCHTYIEIVNLSRFHSLSVFFPPEREALLL
jgi:hypothetical protein